MSSSLGLLLTIAIAAWTDWTRWRIPNWLIAGSAAAALMMSAFAPDRIGLSNYALGGLVGLAVFLPLYVAKGMAAGDVKLMAVCGMYVGPWVAIDIALVTCVVGGAWALTAMVLKNGAGPLPWLMLRWRAVMSQCVPAWAKSVPSDRNWTEMIPYGVVIALATLVVLW